jgi:DNA modification methylase
MPPNHDMPSWPADNPERRPIESLIPYAGNPMTHPPVQIEQLKRSILEYGWTNPVLCDENGSIIAGHGRVMAAAQLGIKIVPVIVAKGWPEARKRAYVIADNQYARLGEWDHDLLKIELTDLKELDFDLSLTGFGEVDLVGFMAGLDPQADAEECPPVPENPSCRPGDLWELGRHRLLCGDATVESEVLKVLGGAKPHLMVTDPPYGVDYDPDWRNRADRANGKPYGGRAIGLVTNDDIGDWNEAWKLFPGDVIYQWHPAGASQVKHYAALVAAGFEIRMQIIWAKQQFPIGRGNYHVQHEPCYYAVREGKTAHWSGDRKQTTLWQIDKPLKSETGHSTQKPIECMKRPIENNSQPGDAVYDPFLGSGTTLIAAEMTGRRCYGIEISPAYCDVTIRRWQQCTGRKATICGVPYDDIVAQRSPAA